MKEQPEQEPGGQQGSEVDFETHRALCFSIAYRMLGSVADAEDLVQESWIRWQANRASIKRPRAWLRQVCTRLAIDRLRDRQRADAPYPGPWLPEPILDGSVQMQAALENRLDAVDSIRIAFLTLLEELKPHERAIYLLRAVFECTYSEIAEIVEQSVDNCRQIFARTRKKLGSREQAPPANQEEQQCLAAFYEAVTQGDLQALLQILDPEVVLMSDGGGKRSAARVPLTGAQRVAHFVLGIAKLQRQAESRLCFRPVNGQMGAQVHSSAGLESVVSYEFRENKLWRIFVMRNPDKLIHLSGERR